MEVRCGARNHFVDELLADHPVSDDHELSSSMQIDLRW
jgi:hypothetical protein